MKKSIEINLGGRIFNIDDDAYELLNEYIESLRANFKDNEEGEEIVADIELRLGELCEERMHDGRARIIDYAMVPRICFSIKHVPQLLPSRSNAGRR